MSCLPILLSSGPLCTFVWTTSMSSPLCSLSIATKLQSQKAVSLTELCVWRLWMLTAPHSTARFASMTSSLPMCPLLLTTMVRYAWSCSSSSKRVLHCRSISIYLSMLQRYKICTVTIVFSFYTTYTTCSVESKFNIQFSIHLQTLDVLNTFKQKHQTLSLFVHNDRVTCRCLNPLTDGNQNCMNRFNSSYVL